MKYCRQTTVSHVICCAHPDCLEDLNGIIQREGFSGTLPFFVNSEVAINCDTAESKIASKLKSNQKRSMDIAVGISDLMTAEMLLVELRLNYTNPNNLDRKVLIEKFDGTTTILKSAVPIHNRIIFVFQENVKQEAISRMARMNPKIPNNFIVMDLSDLKSAFF